jgi:hypothetical protein
VDVLAAGFELVSERATAGRPAFTVYRLLRRERPTSGP